MGLAEIKDEVLSDASKKAEELLKEARSRKEGMQREADGKAASLKQAAKKEAEREAELLTQSIISNARVEANKRALKARHEVLEKTMEEAVEKLVLGKKYEGDLKKNLATVKGAWEIVVSKRDFERLKPKDSTLKAGDIKGGFIARFEDYTINKSIDAVLKLHEQTLAREAAKILFS